MLIKHNYLSILIIIIIIIIIVFVYLFNRFSVGKNMNEILSKHKLLFKNSNIVLRIKEDEDTNYMKNQEEYIKLVKQGHNITIGTIAIGIDILSVDKLTSYLKKIIYIAKQNNVIIFLNQHEDKYKSKTDMIMSNIADYALSINYTNLYVTFQVYRKNSINDIHKFVKKYTNLIGIRIVKGAYLIKDNSTGKVHDDKEIIRNNYINAVKYLHNNNVRVLYATHDRDIRDYIIKHDLYNKTLNSFQSLYGYDNGLDYDYKDFNQDVQITIPSSSDFFTRFKMFLRIIYQFFINRYWYNI